MLLLCSLFLRSIYITIRYMVFFFLLVLFITCPPALRRRAGIVTFSILVCCPGTQDSAGPWRLHGKHEVDDSSRQCCDQPGLSWAGTGLAAGFLWPWWPWGLAYLSLEGCQLVQVSFELVGLGLHP